MTSITQETWEKLDKPTGDKLVARIALPAITSRLFSAKDVNGMRHLLILLDATNEEYHDRQSRGVNVSTRELSIHGKVPERYLDIACLDAGGHPILDLMGGEIAQGLAVESNSPTNVVKNVLAKWRRFWGQTSQPILSKEEQLGLFGELWFLSKWLFPKLGAVAIRAWRGPWGSRHDFEWLDKSVEVKATTSSRGRIHSIHGLSQLTYPETGPLYLFSVCLREENGAEFSLPKLIDQCGSFLCEAAEEMALFENALVHLGYSPFFEDDYSKLKLCIVEEVLFCVKEDFPRLTENIFIGGVPQGVENVNYEINLNTFNHLVITSLPSQLPFM